MENSRRVEADNLFSGFACDYDRMINWNERLERETPFFKKIFSDAGAGRVLDTACATGRHAIMFSSWGLSVAAADASLEMVTAARDNAVKAGNKVDFKVAGLEEIDDVFSPGFDVITCMGNSLPHVKSAEGLNRVFAAAANLLNSGGLFVIQMRNYSRVYEKEEKFMPLNTRTQGEKEYLYLRMTELGQDLVTFNIIVLEKNEAGKWSYRVSAEKLKPWLYEDIKTGLERTGLTISGVYGSLNLDAFNPSESTDLMIIAHKSDHAAGG